MRFGAVSYLNARPLVEGLSPLVLDTPSALVSRYERGEVDVALLPVAAGEKLGARRVGGLGVVSGGPVESVLLFLRKDPERVERLALDPASRTSRVLARIVLAQRYGVEPRPAAPPADAELVIGDAALVRGAGPERRLDLADEWRALTGLPFVFAAWYGDPAAAGALEEAHARGRDRIPEYARDAGIDLPPERLERYLRESIRFRIGEREHTGLRVFLAKARVLGLL